MLQGAQVFNQSVQVFLQDQRARKQLELRKKELDDLAKIREQRLQHEKSVLSLKEEKISIENELLEARRGLLEAQTAAVPIKAEATATTAAARTISAEASQQRAQTGALKAEADIILNAQKVELKGYENQFNQLQQRAIDRKLPKELSSLQGLSISALEKQSATAARRLQDAMGAESFFPEQKQESVGALKNELDKINQALKLRTAAMNEILPAMKMDRTAADAVRGVINKLNQQYPTTREAPEMPAPPRTTFNLQAPEVESLDTRAKSITQQLSENKLIEGQVSEKTLEGVADEIFALSAYPEGLRGVLAALEQSADVAVIEKIVARIQAKQKAKEQPTVAAAPAATPVVEAQFPY